MRTPNARRFLVVTVCLGLLRAETPPSKGPSTPRAPEAPLLLAVPGASSRGAASGQATMAPTVPFAPNTASSTSSNKQFTVYGGDLDLRSAFCMSCDDTAAALGRVLKDDGQFVLPVIVVIKLPPDISSTGPAVTLNIGELTHGGFHLQINAELRTGFRKTDFSRELVRVLLAERILRNHQKLSTTRQTDVLPAWVMTGVTQALEYRSRSRPSALFSAVFKRGRVYSLDSILTADPAKLDALSRGIYETSTCALVLTLLDQPEGPVRFSKFLNALAVESRPDRDLLTQYFPNLAASKSALEKWWSLQMASLATPSAMDTLSVTQTEQELDNALTLLIPGTKKESEPPPPPPPVAAEAPVEKKSGGIFGWLKREPKNEEKSAENPPQESRTTDGEEPKPEVRQQELQEQEPNSESEPTNEIPPSDATKEEAISRVRNAVIPGIFGGKKIIFGFKKKPKPDEAAVDTEKGKDEKGTTEKVTGEKGKDEKAKDEKSKDAAKKAAATAEPAKPVKPDANAAASKAKTEAPEPVASLSKKPGEARSIGSRPTDLPKMPPPAPEKTEKPVADSKAKKPEEPKAEESPDNAEKPRTFRGLFHRRSPEERTAAAEQSPPKPVPAAESKPEAPKVANKPESAPSSTRRTTTRSGTIPIEDFALIAKRKDRSEIFGRCLNNLSALKVRAHPLYQSLIAEYSVVVQELAQGKTKNASTRLEELRHQRDAIHEKALVVETHLDWYEANHTGTLSHDFDDFLRLDDEIERDRLPRNDTLSKYLDAVQTEFK